MGTTIESAHVVYVGSAHADHIERAIHVLGGTIEQVSTIDDCLDILERATALVCGATLEDGTAVDLCECARSHGFDGPIIVFTDDGSEAFAGKVVAAGADGYVPSAAGTETLRTRLRELLEDVTDSIDSSDTLEALQEPTHELLRGQSVGGSGQGVMGQPRTTLLGETKPVTTDEIIFQTQRDGEIPRELHEIVFGSDKEFVGTVKTGRDPSDRTQTERQCTQRNEKIENLHETASKLDACKSETEICELTVEAAAGVLNFDICAVELVRGDHLVTEAISTEVVLDQYRDRFPVDEGIAGKSLQHGQTYRHFDDIDAGMTPESGNCQSILSVPIGNRGVFQAVSTERKAFDRHDEELAELLISHVLDALDRLAFEEKLRAERDRFAALFENVPDAVVSTQSNEDGTPIVEHVNPAFERIFGYEESELVGNSLDRFIIPSSLDAQAEADLINDRSHHGDIVESEVKRRTADGLRDFMMRTVPVKVGKSGERTFGVYTDITEQKQRQKRVEILNRVLRHDLRNGMNIIDGCAEMLAEAIDDETDRLYAETIQERAGELIRLAEKTRAVEQTLDRDTAATGPVDVVDAIEEAINDVKVAYPSANISCSIPDRAFARADDLFRTAIYHIVENAAEHNDLPVAAIDIDLEVSGSEGDELVLTVADNGPGIPTEERELLEEDKEITQLRHASGLGLWLVNWVVTQSGGLLAFDENEPRGTVVTIHVPRAEIAAAQSATDGATAGD